MSVNEAKKVILIEAQAVKDLANRIDGEFNKAIDIIIKCKGRVVVTGMGKTGLIGRKIAATLSSTGTPSLWLHSAEAVHGDLGQVTKNDVVLIISNSGETEETIRLLPILKKIGSKVIALSGNKSSTLAKHSDVFLDISVKKEGCPLGLAPMASTTVTLVMGDAIAGSLILRRGFKKEDFAFYHPGGLLGKKLLLKVEDIMRHNNHFPKVDENLLIKDVLLAITQSRCGSACVVNRKGTFVGIFTDGDLRRHLETHPNLLSQKVKDYMTHKPITINKDKLAAEALNILQEKKIDELPVVDKNNRLVGLLDVQDLLRVGMI